MIRRKFYAILTVLSVMLSVCFYAGEVEASEYEKINLSSVNANEYLTMKELANSSDIKLISEGYTENEIKEIRDYKNIYEKHIRDLSNLDESVLKAHGYSSAQINDIKNFNGSESQMIRAAASCNINASHSNFTALDGDLTRGKVTFSWVWTGVPAYKLTDIVAFTWNSWVVSSYGSTVGYYNVNTGASVSSKSATFSTQKHGTDGGKFTFKMTNGDGTYAKSGSGYLNVKSDTYCAKNIYYYFEYGHSKVVPTADLSFTIIGSPGFADSIDFSINVTTEDAYDGKHEFTP